MAIAKVAPNGQKRVPTSAKYLTIIKTSGALTVFNEEFGVNEFQLKQNSIVETEGVKSLFFVNKSDVELVVEYQTTDLKVFSGDSGTVEITGSVVVDRIEQGITVTTSVGSVEIIVPNTVDDLVDIPLPANSKVLAAAADAERKEIMIQLSGSTFSTVRVGSVNVSNNRGRILQGGGAQVGDMTLVTSGEIYVHNTTNNALTLSVGIEKHV
ncbi:MAG: hypothetical protein MJK12_12405 [Colwellia sp.]|nr:hypothetical protein [Colwellia sp.]